MPGALIADTSVWIDFFNGFDSPEKALLKFYILDDKPVFLIPLILQEILQGFKYDKDYEKAKELLQAFPFLNYDPLPMAVQAAALYRRAIKKGITIRRANDCLIAAVAIEYKIPLLHKDSDFDALQYASDLQILKA